MTKAKNNSFSGQHCCQLHGWLENLVAVKGNFVTIIHSDMDCSNLIPKRERELYDLYDRFFCTNLDDHDIILGKSTAKLKDCIKTVYQEIKPQGILVLGSCMSILINDDVETVVEEARKAYDLPIFYQKTSGFSFDDPRRIMDATGEFLFSIHKDAVKTKKDKKSVNLIGFDYFMENFKGMEKERSDPLQDLAEELSLLGDIKINALINPHTTPADWSKIKNATCNITFDKNIYPNFCGLLAKKYDLKTVETPFPVGLQSTLDFYKKICSALGINYTQAVGSLTKQISEIKKQLKAKQKFFKNKPLVYNIASALDFSVTNSAKEGLLHLPFFRELGFKVELLIQGNPEKAHRLEVQKILHKLKIPEPFTLFGHCGDAYNFLKQKKRPVVYGADLIKQQALAAGCLFLNYTELKPGLKNVIPNIEKLSGRKP
jgi:nitrogenase molybdenum-iron protein alpha/beta subunit